MHCAISMSGIKAQRSLAFQRRDWHWNFCPLHSSDYICYERQALRFSSYRLHAEMPRSWPFATISEPGKHLASCVGRHSHLGRAIWALMVWNGNPAFDAEGLWSSQRMSSPRRGRLIEGLRDALCHSRHIAGLKSCILIFAVHSIDHNLWWVRG